jgi:hypothetical protein
LLIYFFGDVHTIRSRCQSRYSYSPATRRRPSCQRHPCSRCCRRWKGWISRRVDWLRAIQLYVVISIWLLFALTLLPTQSFTLNQCRPTSALPLNPEYYFLSQAHPGATLQSRVDKIKYISSEIFVPKGETMPDFSFLFKCMKFGHMYGNGVALRTARQSQTSVCI